MANGNWFYIREGQREGPLSEAELLRLFEVGALSPDTLVWSSSLNGWTPASGVPAFRVVTPPPPPPDDRTGVSAPSSTHAYPPTTIASVVVEPRPWVRYWARYLDLILFGMVVGIVAGIIAPSMLEGRDILLSLGIAFAWLFVEAMLLSSWGTTPGKWLFKTTILPKAGGTLAFPTALKRSFLVYLKGIGIGFPLAAIITMLVALYRLQKNKQTTWDRDCGSIVVHQPIGALRATAGALIVIGAFALFALGKLTE